MAIWYAQSSNGNINDANKWGNTPTSPSSYLTFSNLAAGDILQLNGKTNINVNVSFACTRVSSTAEGGLGTASGNLAMSSGSIEIGTSENRTDIKAGGSTVLSVTGGILVIYGEIIGSDSSNTARGIDVSGNTASLTVNGKLIGGGSSAGMIRNGDNEIVINATDGIALYSGDSPALQVISGGGTIEITGDIDGTNLYGGALTIANVTASIVVTGDVYGGGGDCQVINFHSNYGGTLEINGDITAGEYGAGVYVSGVGHVTVRGNVIGGGNTETACVGILSEADTSPIVYGDVIASENSPGVCVATLTALPILIEGSLIDSLRSQSCSGNVRLNPLPTSYRLTYDWNDNPIKMPLQLPAPVVKKGVVTGDTIGILPPASAFRRTDRFV
jgi:hypothetical protein